MWPGAQARVGEVKICLWGGGEQWVVTRQSQRVVWRGKEGCQGQGGRPLPLCMCPTGPCIVPWVLAPGVGLGWEGCLPCPPVLAEMA